MLRWRLLLGTLFIALVIALCWLDVHAEIPGIWLLPLAMAVTVLASSEMLWLVRNRPSRPLTWVVHISNLLIVAANWSPFFLYENHHLGLLGWPLLALAVAVLLVFAGEMQRYSVPGGVTERIALAVLTLCYVGLLMTFVIQLRLLDRGPLGVAALASLIIVVKCGDTGAYTFGRLFGRRKMAPVLSPGKTYEGAIGGLASACLGSWLCFHLLLPAIVPVTDLRPLASFGWLWYGLIVGLAGMLGDLAESLLKRDLGAKDSSPWMPGFGGVLDTVDSILFAAPLAYGCWALALFES